MGLLCCKRFREKEGLNAIGRPLKQHLGAYSEGKDRSKFSKADKSISMIVVNK